MSDFFGDDFTIELKLYFVEALLTEVESFIDLVDASTWKKLIPEIQEKTETWSVDAISNEFTFLADWIVTFRAKSKDFENETFFARALQQLKSYLLVLKDKKKDSAEIAANFLFEMADQKEHLYLACDLGQHEFVISVQYICEVIAQTPIHPLPEKAQKFLGLITFRGEALPLFDLGAFGFAFTAAEKSCFVICEWKGQRFALQMHAADKLIKMSAAEVQKFNKEASLITADFAQDFFIKDNKSVMILDIEKLVAA